MFISQRTGRSSRKAGAACSSSSKTGDHLGLRIERAVGVGDATSAARKRGCGLGAQGLPVELLTLLVKGLGSGGVFFDSGWHGDTPQPNALGMLGIEVPFVNEIFLADFGLGGA